MKTIIGGRRSGKTTALLRQIYMDGYSNPVIVVPNNTMKAAMIARLWPMTNVKVMTFRNYLDLCDRSRTSVASGEIPTFYFDNIEMCLQTEAPRMFVTNDDTRPPMGHNSISSIGGITMTVDDDVSRMIHGYFGMWGTGNKPSIDYIKDIWGHRETDNKPHIDRVKFNGPATIVFWKDGTKTVVKFDGEGAKSKKLAILYAFIRKIYGEGKNYHYILGEIDNACFTK